MEPSVQLDISSKLLFSKLHTLTPSSVNWFGLYIDLIEHDPEILELTELIVPSVFILSKTPGSLLHQILASQFCIALSQRGPAKSLVSVLNLNDLLYL